MQIIMEGGKVQKQEVQKVDESEKQAKHLE
jgi:hypothetical protein